MKNKNTIRLSDCIDEILNGYEYQNELGIRKKKSGRKRTISEQKISDIHDLHNKGLTAKYISDKLDVSISTVYYYLRR